MIDRSMRQIKNTLYNSNRQGKDYNKMQGQPASPQSKKGAPCNRLPAISTKEIKELDKELEARIRDLERMNADLEREKGIEERILERKYEPAMNRNDRAIERLYTKIDSAWDRVRSKYPVVHPRMKKRFTKYSDAAEVLAHYWQGRETSKKQLIRKISNSAEIYAEAIRYAEHLTKPHSPERKYVERAGDFLWNID